jgi:hypothetical protein
LNDPILKAATFTFEVDGVTFVMKRRSTFVMAQARGFQAVLGSIGGEDAVANDETTISKVTDKQTLNLVEGVLRAALIEPVLAEEGKPTVSGQCYSFEDLAPFHDACFRQFMTSGLDAAPLPSSCGETTEQPS